MNNKFLSLKTAAQLYGYTRDHLGLMIRQGKLKGTKLGNYYVTTNDWMAEYIKNFADPGHPAVRNKLSNKFLSDILSDREEPKPVDFSRAVKNLQNSSPKKTNLSSKNPVEFREDDFARPAPFGRPEKNRNFEEDILRDLEIYNRRSGGLSEPDEGPLMSERPSLIDSHYTILPLRKMKESERIKILGRLKELNDKNDWEEED